MKVEAITRSIELGEGPIWDHERKLLFFVNLYASEVHSFEPETNEHCHIKIGKEPVTFILPVAGKKDEFMISYGRHLKRLQWDGKSEQFVVNPHCLIEERGDSRMNDGKTSPSGVIFAGSMGNEKGTDIPDKQGSLYVIKKKTPKKLLDEIGISNGVAWNSNETEFYWNDTLASKTYKFEYDRETQTISNQTILIDFKERNIEGLPDGMAIDIEENLWIACIKGRQIIRVCPKSGSILLSVPLPCTDVTSVVFGGPNYDILFCSTSTHNVDPGDLTPEAGCILKITGLPTRGLPISPAEV